MSRDMAGKTDATRETILIVDDEPAVRRATGRMLGAEGYEVLTAESGPQALTLCEEHPRRVAMALIDVVMPAMTGPELADRLRSSYRGIKIVFMSGYAVDEIGDLGVMDPNAHFLGKPFSADILRRKVRDVLDGA